MEKNKILEAARNNKSRGCEYESKESMRSSILCSIIAILVGIVLFMVEYFVKDTVNISLIAVGMTAACVKALYEGIKNKKTYLIILGIIDTLIVLSLILVFIAQVVS